MKRFKNLLILFLVMMGLLLSCTVAKADSLSITLASPYQIGPGPVYEFIATVTNNSSKMVYLNSDSAYVDSPLILDPSPYVYDWPLTLGAGDSYTGILFDVDVPDGTPIGLYTGYFDITGGHYNSSEQYTVGTADFNIYVTPEPSSLLLLASGLAGIAGTLKRRLVG
jgi:hypothetical protein